MAKEKQCAWHFRSFRPNEDELRGANDPIIQKFKENFFNSLVRESIQNSMDAKGENESIEVKYDLGTIRKEDYPELFNLRKHIVSCKDTHGDNNRAQEIYGPMAEFIDTDELDIITVSDYGTEGMPYYPGNIYKNPFLAFVNSEGQSVKTTTSSDGKTVSNGGSFGIGKGAYFLMSPVRSLLVSTMVNDDKHSTYFEGVSRLCTHDIGDDHYYHMGFYCIDGKTPAIGDDIPDMFRREAPGTSISLIGKYADLGSRSNVEDEIERAVISNFWLAIHKKKLTVTVGQRTPINMDSLEQKMLLMFTDDYAKGNPILFYRAYVTPPDKRRFFMFEINDDEYLGHCELYVRMGEPGKKDMVTCMRDMMMLIQTIPSPRQHHAGVTATFLCLGEPGNSNFELAEEESHTSWSSRGKQGEAKKRTNELLRRMYTFIGDSIDSIIGVNGDKIDVTIETFNNTDMDEVVAEEGVGGNPFGTVKDVDQNIKNGFDRFSLPDSTKKREGSGDPEQGNVISGPTEGSSKKGVTPVATGPITVKKVKRKKPQSKPGGGKKKVDTTPSDGPKEYLIIPANFDVAAHLDKGEWVHTIYIELQEDVSIYEKAYIDISVGMDNAQEGAKVDIKSAQMDGKNIQLDHSRVMLKNFAGDNLTIDVTFKDNIRHTLNLG